MPKNDKKYLWQDRKRTLFGLPWSFTIYKLDEQRLFVQKGVFNITEDEVRLYRILDISLSMNLFQRLFGVGSIHCCSADKTMADFDIKNIKNPRAVKEQISALVEKQRDERLVVSREALHHTPHTGDSDDPFGGDLDGMT